MPLLFPGDLLIVAAGLRGATGAGWPLVVAVAALASMLGSSLLYAVTRYAGRALVLRYARVLHVDEYRLARAEGWLARRGGLAIVAGRLVPGLRTPTTLACGVLGVPYRVFAPATALAAIAWAAAYYLVGVVAHAQGTELVAVLGGDVDLVFVLAGTAAVGVLLLAAVRRARP